MVETLVCADWSKEPQKRAVRLARVSSRTIEQVPSSPSQSLSEILSLAERERKRGPVLVAFDAVLGVPRGYLDLAREKIPQWRETTGFLDWLELLEQEEPLFTDLSLAATWSPRTPFFRVPHGKGAFRQFREREDVGIERLYRRADLQVHAKPVFAACGIPGTVGSGSRALWQELAPLLRAPRSFRVWPFEGEDLDQLLQEAGIVLAEVYPRAVYATALAEFLPAKPRSLAKTKRDIREKVLQELKSASWIEDNGVVLGDQDAAEASEDDFDALLTAAALLRYVLTNQPLFDPDLVDSIEGGILGVRSVALYLLCGMAFSGKTTLAAVLSRHLQAEVVSLDDVNASRGLHGGVGAPDAEWARTHQEALRRVAAALKAGRSVIVDDTNCFRFLRDSYRAVATPRGIETTVIYLDRPLSLIRERVRQNDRVRTRPQVLESVLLDLAHKFEPPTPDEQVLLFPADVTPEVWTSRHLPAPR
jgi:predicted kinase